MGKGWFWNLRALFHAPPLLKIIHHLKIPRFQDGNWPSWLRRSPLLCTGSWLARFASVLRLPFGPQNDCQQIPRFQDRILAINTSGGTPRSSLQTGPWLAWFASISPPTFGPENGNAWDKVLSLQLSLCCKTSFGRYLVPISVCILVNIRYWPKLVPSVSFWQRFVPPFVRLWGFFPC